MNSLMPLTTTVTELQRNYKKVARKAKQVKQPIVILANNKPQGIYMDYDMYTSSVSAGVSDKSNEKYSPKGTFSKFSGLWSKKEADEFDKVIEENFEQINPESWK